MGAMVVFDPIRYSVRIDHPKATEEMKKIVESVLPLLGAILACLSGCTHVSSPISVRPAVDNISAVQGNLSAIDGKAVVIESYLKSH